MRRIAWLLSLPCLAQPALDPANMRRAGTVDDRFQSFNVEMVEVTGGRFWAPYGAAAEAAEKKSSQSSGIPAVDPSLFRIREPIDLGNARLRKLAAALGPSYMRVSGTWANSTYFHDSDDPAPASPPRGFGGILTRRQWRGVMDFSRAVNASLVTSFAISDGVRDDSGVWTPKEAAKVLAFTKSAGGHIAAAELFNEPSLAALGGAPKGYDAAAYGKDFKVFLKFVRQAAPDLLVAGPGSFSEAGSLPGFQMLASKDLLTAAGPGLDVFSYHFYGAPSKRCAAMAASVQTTAEAALTEQWLSRTDLNQAFYAALRDRFEPGKPLWLTETAETACGGNPWASSFLDSFRYLDQLGRLARSGVQVVMHNTLAASDYGLIDESTMTPRPNYWAALLWKRLMGKTVLDVGLDAPPALHLYGHCLAGHPGGVAVLAINTDSQTAFPLTIPSAAQRYTLSASAGGLMDTTVRLNGKPLGLGSKGDVPPLTGRPAAAGMISVGPATITFLTFAGANNGSCR